jgi:predicted amidohydrolase
VAATRRADLVALPEYALYRGPAGGQRSAARPIPGELTRPFEELARSEGIAILLGSVPESSDDPARPYNTSVAIDADGTIRATYRKVHLFDVSVDSGPDLRESDVATGGDETVVTTLRSMPGVGPVRLGLSICYDLRFPELYRALALAGAEVIVVPATFTERTGRDHWEPLLRARAIENQVFVLAPAAWGTGGGITAYGRSVAIDPWGTVLAQAPDGPGGVVVDLDLDRIESVRRQVPSLANRRPAAYERIGSD